LKQNKINEKKQYSIEFYIAIRKYSYIVHICIQLHFSFVATLSLCDYRYWYKLPITTMWQSHFHRCINGNGIAVRGCHGFDIPLPSRAINLPGVAANVVDIQDSKCEGRVNVTGEGSVSKRTMRYPSGRLGLPRDEGKRRGLPGTGLVRARANRNGWPKGLPYERLLDIVPRQIEPSSQTFALTYVRQKKRRLSPAAADSPRFQPPLKMEWDWYLAVKRSERRHDEERFGRTKVRTSACPFFCDSQAVDVIYRGMCGNYVRKYMWKENESVLVVDETFFLLHGLFRIMEEIGRNGYGLLGPYFRLSSPQDREKKKMYR